MFVSAVSQQPGPDAVWSSLVRLQSLGLEFLLLNNHGADFQHFLVELSTNPREVSHCPIRVNLREGSLTTLLPGHTDRAAPPPHPRLQRHVQ